jgi:peptidoglycan/xylan/chitin deacetylase (PgdA/CDA1 family)
MSGWLAPVENALDQAVDPVAFFFRDDDGGWDDERLFRLLDLFADHDLPLDMAVIPQALTEALARKISERVEMRPERIGVHQHGFAHVNHEMEGRKCEFGPARSSALQDRDIESGKRLLAERLGAIVQPIFTPPWNRCSAVTGDCLVRHGFRVLSRDDGAEPLNVSGLFELPVRVDWFAKRKSVRLDLNQLGALIAAAIKAAGPVGIMFHHALMDDGERTSAGELLALLARHDQAHCHLMRDCAPATARRIR